jgi:two-component system CheB/CheR fusion protein
VVKLIRRETGSPPESPEPSPDTDSRSTDDPDDLSADDDTLGLSVVGIGAARGGFSALKHFFSALPADCPMAFVIVQIDSSNPDESLVDRLEPHTPIEIRPADDKTAIAPGTAYVAAPGCRMIVCNGKLLSSPAEAPAESSVLIDRFFESLATDYREQAVSLILSGDGTDGSIGLKAIKERGGITMAQEPGEALHSGMPESAVGTRLVDFVEPVDRLAGQLARWSRHDRPRRLDASVDRLTADDSHVIHDILELLEERTGNDFELYKKSTVLRRIARRLQVLQIETLPEYLERLKDSSDEVRALWYEMLISVTRFFREPQTWEAVDEQIIPAVFEAKGPDDQVRVWVPGCATGEEAYTIAMLLEEYADGLDNPPTVRIFATDVNDDSIVFARKGRYSRPATASLPAARLERFFVPDGDGFRIRKSLRRSVVFATQNVLTDPPFANIDFVSCRNLLIYLNRPAQQRVLETFHYALHPSGYLLVGASESTKATARLYREVGEASQLYRAVGSESQRGLVRGRAHATGRPQSRGLSRHAPPATEPDGVEPTEQLHRRALVEHWAPPSILVDADRQIIHIHGDVGPYLRLPPGEPSQRVVELIAPQLRPLLRTNLFRIFDKQEAPLAGRVELSGTKGPHIVEVQAQPIEDADGRTFVEFSFRPLPDAQETTPTIADESSTLVDQLEEQLGTTRRRLHAVIEDYETANEELKSSNEELQSMNQQLQSTSEELETSREQLQSANEELSTVNDELHLKITELDSVNSDLENLLASTAIGTVFLDHNLKVRRFTDPATDCIHLIDSDCGRPFEHISHELQEDRLAEDARQVLETLEVVERENRSAGGQEFIVRTLPYVTSDEEVDGVVITFIDITSRRRYEQALLAAKEQAEELAEVRSQFMATLSHEVRSPLAAILTYAEVLSRDLEGEPRTIIERIRTSGERLHDSLESVLRLARLEAGEQSAQPERFDLAAHVGQAVDFQRQLIGQKELKIEECNLEEPVEVYLDPRFIDQIVTNLLDNAVKYTKRGQITVTLEADSQSVVLTVTDTGIGIARAETDTIFDQFRRTQRAEMHSQSGSGLGLPITKLLVESLGGEIAVETAENVGSTFTVRLPRQIVGIADG